MLLKSIIKLAAEVDLEFDLHRVVWPTNGVEVCQ